MSGQWGKVGKLDRSNNEYRGSAGMWEHGDMFWQEQRVGSPMWEN